MKDLIGLIAKTLVEDEAAVQVREGERGRGFQLRVADPDLGRLIGRRGRTANSIRTLVQFAAGRRVDLDIDSHSGNEAERGERGGGGGRRERERRREGDPDAGADRDQAETERE